jgi:hypothetical protein
MGSVAFRDLRAAALRWLAAARRFRVARPSRLGAVTYGVTQSVLLLWWLAFYPGLMSYDTVTYVWQVSTGNWSSNHSVLYDAAVWLSLQITGELFLLTLAQTIAAAAGVAYVVTGLRRLGPSARWLLVAATLLVCLPAAGTFMSYVSKDVAFVITQVWLLGTITRVVAIRRERPGSPVVLHRLLWALFAELTLLGLFRQNGFLVVVVTAALAAVALPGLRGRLAAIGGGAVITCLFANLVFYPALGVRSPGSELLLGTAYGDLAVAYHEHPGIFTASDRAVMAKVAPLDYWSSSANCYTSDTTVTGQLPFSLAAAREHQSELAALWLRVVKRRPDVVMQTRLCRGSIAWNPFPGPAHGWTVKPQITGVAVLFNFSPEALAASPYAGAIRSAPPIHKLHRAAVWARRLSDTRSFEWFAWRGATWCYIAYLAAFLWGRRRRELGALALVAVVVANQLTVLINNPNQLVRYMMGPLVLGILLLPLAFVTEPPARRAGGREYGREDSEPRHTAELTVPSVAQTRHDKRPVVEPLVDGGRHHAHRQPGAFQAGDALRRGEHADDRDIGASALGDEPDAMLERATGGEHRVQHHDRPVGEVDR